MAKESVVRAGRRSNEMERSPTPSRPRRTLAICALALAANAAIAAASLLHPKPLLMWNASGSSPIGLYLITSSNLLRIGDFVAAWPPPPARRLASERNYLPASVPLVKRVAALAGDRICAARSTISINGGAAVVRHVRDPLGRALPWWSGCRRLKDDELFLLSPRMPSAFDGRYFGLTRRAELIGRAKLLWRR
jgi:conjugative transfer signal peptidase TraF